MTEVARERTGRWVGPAWSRLIDAALVAGLALLAALMFTRILPLGAVAGRAAAAAAAATALAEIVHRRRGSGFALSVAVTLVGYVVVVGAVVFRAQTWFGLPTPASVHAVADGALNGAARILTSAVPTPPVPAALIIPVSVAWLTAFAGSELAWRTRSPLLPAVPALLGFVFGLLFGGVAPLVGISAGFVAATGALGAVRAARITIPSGRGQRRRLIRVALPAVVVMAVGAALVGNAFGTSTSQFDLHSRLPAGQPFPPAVTPLSQIQGQLLTQPPVGQFEVTVPAGAVDLLPDWRLTVLDRFDGTQWSTDETFVPAGGTLPPPPSTDAPTTQVTEHVTVQRLSGYWLPVGGDAVSTSLSLVDVGTRSGVLAAPSGHAAGLSYSVDARLTDVPSDLLADASPVRGVAARADTGLPELAPTDLAAIKAKARAVVGKATNTVDQLTALEDYLRTQPFATSALAQAGESYARTASFIGPNHYGTSELFASTFAIMARSLGIPTRVAVGFRRGVPTGGGHFVLTSADAYAWPEVDFQGLGWVPFDPTPDLVATGGASADAAPTVGNGSSTNGVAELVPQESGSTDQGQATGASGLSDWIVAGLSAGAALLAVLIIGPLVVIWLKRRRARRRRRGSPRRRIAGAWTEVTTELGAGASGPGRSLTATEVVVAAAPALGPEAGMALDDLGLLVNRALFADPSPSEADATRAWSDAATITRRARRSRTRRRRLIDAVDPRPLVGAGRS